MGEKYTSKLNDDKLNSKVGKVLTYKELMSLFSEPSTEVKIVI